MHSPAGLPQRACNKVTPSLLHSGPGAHPLFSGAPGLLFVGSGRLARPGCRRTRGVDVRSRLGISPACPVIMPYHELLDQAREKAKEEGGRQLAAAQAEIEQATNKAREALHSLAGRELIKIDLFEVSLVTHPLQHGARIHLVS